MLVQRVVMRNKWPRVRPCRNRHQDGRVHLNEPPAVEEPANAADDATPLHESFRNLRVGDQVQVSLTVAGFHVPKPVPFLRKRPHPLGQHGQRLRFNRRLSRPRAHHVAGYAQEIPEIQVLQHPVFLAQRVLAQHRLQRARGIPQIQKCRAPHNPHRHDPSCHAEGFGILRRAFGLSGLKQIDRIRRRATPLESRRIRVYPSLPDALQFGSPALQVGLKAARVFGDVRFCLYVGISHSVAQPLFGCFVVRAD